MVGGCTTVRFNLLLNINVISSTASIQTYRNVTFCVILYNNYSFKQNLFACMTDFVESDIWSNVQYPEACG